MSISGGLGPAAAAETFPCALVLGFVSYIACLCLLCRHLFWKGLCLHFSSYTVGAYGDTCFART